MSMARREFIFKIEEVVNVGNDIVGSHYVVSSHSGYVRVDEDGKINISVDDLTQPYGQFESKDSFFNKIIKKIHKATGRR